MLFHDTNINMCARHFFSIYEIFTGAEGQCECCIAAEDHCDVCTEMEG